MIKALVKKQLRELYQGYFVNRKTGKARSKAGIFGYFALFAFIMLYLLVIFFFVAKMLAPLAAVGYGHLYYTIMLLMSTVLGVFGSVFNTYAGLYHAKDNEFLLSLPIPPSKILIARLISVYLMGLMYSSVVIIPSVVAYYFYAPVTVLSLVFSVLLVFIQGFFVLSVTCILGYFVALISSKLKNKSIITVFASLAFVMIYYFSIGKMGDVVNEIVQDPTGADSFTKNWFNLIYQGGKAFCGEVLPMLLFSGVSIGIFLIILYVMAKSFVKITTVKTSEKKAEFSEKKIKTASIGSALLKKEFMRFKSSATYMLNCGLSIIFMPVIGIIMLVKNPLGSETIREILAETPAVSDFFPIVTALLPLLLLSMSTSTAASVSLEGKSVWVVQTLPVEARDVLASKQKMHIILNVPSALIFSVCLCFAFKLEFTKALYAVIFTVISVMFISAFGLFLNLKMPNLSWTNETYPIKQSMPVFIAIFAPMLIAVTFGIGFFFARKIMNAEEYMLIMIVLFALVTRFINTWIRKQGAEIFSKL